MRTRTLTTFSLGCITLLNSICVANDGTDAQLNKPKSWKLFRGGEHNGFVGDSDFPSKWGEKENLSWKVAIHGRGWSSPVIDGRQVWLTTATEDGSKMSVLCLDAMNGKVLFDEVVFENDKVQPDFHVTNSYASSTPVLDSECVYVHFGAYGTACIDRSSFAKVWERRDLPCNHYRGAGSSPILFEDLLIFHMDGFDFQYAIALNKKTGETAWKQDRSIDYGSDNGDFYKAFSTPLLINVGGQPQLISPASKATLALDPRSGEELWRVRYAEHSTTVRPVFDGERIYLSTGFSKAKMMAVTVDGKGDVTDTHTSWVLARGVGSKPSPVLAGGFLFDVTDDGILSRIDCNTGKAVWKKRLGGKFSASLIASNKKLLAFDHNGKGYSFTVEKTPQLIAQNELDSGCNASPAVVGDALFVRTTDALYRFDSKE